MGGFAAAAKTGGHSFGIFRGSQKCPACNSVIDFLRFVRTVTDHPWPWAEMNREDEEGDIRDDALASAVHRDVGRVLGRTDHRLILLLVVAGVVIVLVEKAGIKSTWTDIASIIAIVGILSFTVYSAIRGQRKVASKYGLTCPGCGHTPMPHKIMSAVIVRSCAKCGRELKPVIG
jgi:hypothetical protein